MWVEEPFNVVFDEVKVTKEIEIDNDKELEEVVMKTPTPTNEESPKKEL